MLRHFNTKIILYASGMVGVVVFLWIGIFFWYAQVPAAKSSIDDNLGGHAWDTYYGWLSYNSCNPIYPVNVGDPVVNNCYIYDWGINATIDIDGGGNVTGGSISGTMWQDSLGWICVGTACGSYTAGCGSDLTPPQGNLDVRFAPPESSGWYEITQGWGKICAWSDAGDASWVSFTCRNTGCGSSDYRLYINLNDFTLGDPNNASPACVGCGFLWNGYTVGGDDFGTGWISLNSQWSVSHTVHVETERGDVYAKGKIESVIGPGTGRYNAMYLVLTNGTIVYFESEERYKTIVDSYLRQGFDDFSIPKEIPGTSVYTNALGSLDVQGMKDGDFGTVNSVGATLNGSLLLAGQVWRRAGDLTVDTPLAFQVGAGVQNGSGTIIVEGDLTITADITYETTNVSSVSNIPSAAWIVLGDVIIDPSVTEVAGSFFVLGSGATCPVSLTDSPGGCGRFSTGASAAQALTVNGLVMAKQFNFQRLYTDILNNPSERIVFDGRLIANIPPGFDDFTKNLPIFKENMPF